MYRISPEAGEGLDPVKPVGAPSICSDHSKAVLMLWLLAGSYVSLFVHRLFNWYFQLGKLNYHLLGKDLFIRCIVRVFDEISPSFVFLDLRA